MLRILQLGTETVKLMFNMVDRELITQNLVTLGLTSNEATVYQVLIEKGAQSVLQLSKLTSIPRATVYRICNTLLQKQFVIEVVDSNRVLIEAVPAEELTFLVKAQEQRLAEITNTIDSLKEAVQTELHHVPTTKVKYYQGKKGLQQMIWNCLRAKDEIVGYSEFGRIDVVGEKFYQSYVEEFKSRGLSDRVLTNIEYSEYISKYVSGNSERHQLDEDQIRFLDKSIFPVTGDTSLYNNTYAVSYWNLGEIVGVEIENPQLVKLHRSIFEILWKLGKPVSD